MATYEKIREYAAHGGIVIATRGVPSTAPGFLHAAEESARIQQISRELFASSGKHSYPVVDESQLGAKLSALLQPDVMMTPKTSAIGFVHRKLEDGDVYFFANTGPYAHRVTLAVRSGELHAEWWDPFTGESTPTDRDHLVVTFQPYESRVLVLFNHGALARTVTAGARVGAPPSTKDLSDDWQVSFEGLHRAEHFAHLHSWTDADPYYSGSAVYTKDVDVPAKAIASGYRLTLDFGAATPLPLPRPLPRFNMRAYLDAPVCDVAEVSINGRRAGVVWRPPYQLDITQWLHAGRNTLRLVVANTAVNEMAGRSQPDDRLLNARFGKRFEPQDLEQGVSAALWFAGPAAIEGFATRAIVTVAVYTQPPSMIRLWFVIARLSFEPKNSTSFATSSGAIRRWIACR